MLAVRCHVSNVTVAGLVPGFMTPIVCACPAENVKRQELVLFALVLELRDDAEIRFAVEPADDIALKRDDVVNLVSHAGFPREPQRLCIERLDGFQGWPTAEWRASLPSSASQSER
jgi:hypothetical protein